MQLMDSLFVLPQDEVYYTLLTFAPIDKLRPEPTQYKRNRSGPAGRGCFVAFGHMARIL